MQFKVVRICESDALSVIPKESVRFDIDRSAEILEGEGYEVDNAGVMLIAKKEGMEITVYRNGRLMIHPIEDRERAAEIAEAFYSTIEEGRED